MWMPVLRTWQNMARLGGNPRRRSLRRKWMTLPNGLRYSLEAYRNEQIQGTRWMSSRAAATLAFILRMRGPSSAPKAERTLKSYLLQEAEAASREIEVCGCCVVSLSGWLPCLGSGGWLSRDPGDACLTVEVNGPGWPGAGSRRELQ